MHLIDSQNAVDGRFVAGNPETGKPPTHYTADWSNMLQEELHEVLKQAGIEPKKTDNTQLYQALIKIIQGNGNLSEYVKKSELSTVLAHKVTIDDEDTSEIELPVQPGMNIYQFDNIWPTQNDYFMSNFYDADAQPVQQSGWQDYAGYGGFSLPMCMFAHYWNGGDPFRWDVVYANPQTNNRDGMRGSWGLYYDDELETIYSFGGIEYPNGMRTSFIAPLEIKPETMKLHWYKAATRFKSGGEIKAYNQGGVING